MGKKWYLHQQDSSKSVFMYSEGIPMKNPVHPERPLGKVIDIVLPKKQKSSDGVTVSNSLLLNVANIVSSHV